MDRYFILYKPVNMVSQFLSSHDVPLLGSIDFDFPENTHAIGRLDKDSEGLLLLTTDKKITRLLFSSEVPHKRTYIVQVKNIIKPETVEQLSKGIAISAPMGGKFCTTPCQVRLIDPPAYIELPDKRLHENQPCSWLEIVLTEGKYRQVRKMVAGVRHKCIRLIRTRIEDLDIIGMKGGEVKEVSKEWFYEKLKI